MSQIVSSTVEKTGGAFNISLFQGATLVKVVVGAVIGVAVVASVATAGIVLGVRAQPSPPKAIDDVYTIPKNKPEIFYPTSNDIAIEKDNIMDPNQIFLDSAIPGDIKGTVTYDTEAKSVTYTPAKGFVGLETFKYVVRNTKRSAEGHINVTVVNQPPVAVKDDYTGDDSLARKQDHDLHVLDNDTDADDGDKELLTIESFTQPESIGEVVRSADKKYFTFKPHPTATGTGFFHYTVTDGNDSSTTKVTINLVNMRPVAVNDDYPSVIMNSGANTFDVLVNDSDPNGDDLTITRVGATSLGNAQVDATKKTIQYVPNWRQSGNDAFDYFITDSYVAPTEEGHAIVTVKVLNKEPVAQPLTISNYKSSETQTFDLELLLSDENPYTTLEVAASSGDYLGSVTYSSVDTEHTVTYNGEERTWTEKKWTAHYTPLPSVSYKEVVEYTVTDGVNPVTGHFTVEMKNKAPTASPMSIEVLLNSKCTNHTLVGVSDPDGDATKIFRMANPDIGKVKVLDAAAKLFEFCVDSQYPGSDTVDYIVQDDQNQAEYNEYATSKLTITIKNNPPVCKDFEIEMYKRKEASVSIPQELCHDPDGDPLTNFVVTGGSPNIALADVQDSFIMISSKTLSGTVPFTYSVSDGKVAAGGTITVTVDNRQPSTNALSATFARKDKSSVTFSPSMKDLDGDTVTIKSLAVVSDYDDGEVSADSQTVTYDNIKFSIVGSTIVAAVTDEASSTEHTRAIRYTVQDVDTVPKTFTSTVTATVTSTAPWAEGATVSYEQGIAKTVNLVTQHLAGDVDGDSLTFAVTNLNTASPIAPSVDTSGVITYPADSTYCVSDVVRFTVTAVDGQASADITFVPTNCKCLNKPADVCFVIDKSGSVFSSVGSDPWSSTTYAKWQQQIGFAKQVANAFEYGQSDTQAAIVTFNDNAYQILDLSSNKQTVLDTFQDLYEERDANKYAYTQTAKGFAKCRSILRDSDRQKIYILLSDGVATEKDDARAEVESIKAEDNTHIISVGIGMFDEGRAELLSYASNEDSFFDPATFDDLDDYLDELIGNACAA